MASENEKMVRLSHIYGLHCGDLTCEACAEMVRLKLCPNCGAA